MVSFFSLSSAVAFTASCVGSFLLATLSQAAPSPGSDDFSAPDLSRNWAIAKGDWTITEGRLKGSEIAADKHAAVATYRAPHRDSKVTLDFQLAGSGGFHLSFNHPKGHLFRISVSETGARLFLDKDKKDPTSKAKTLAQAEVEIKQGKNYTMTCETAGETVTVTIGKDVELQGSHPALAREKTGYRLVVKGEGVLFDDFKIESSE